MKLDIVKVPGKILKQEAKLVSKMTPELKVLAKNMLETMRESNGMGLAAPQVGQSIRLLVTGYTSPAKKNQTENVPETVIFNPKITFKSPETDLDTEACLSIPGVTGVVERFVSITVTGIDVNGKPLEIKATKLYARVLQHEIDHLDGILFTDRLPQYKVVFFGTPEFATPSLSVLIAHPQFEVVAVVTSPSASPVKRLAEKHHIPVFQPVTLPRNTVLINALQKLDPDFIVLVAYGKILPDEILKLPKVLCLNVHPSLLPKYRGPSPVQSVILHGESETGVAMMVMVPQMDAGPIISMYKYPILPTDTTGSLSARLSDVASLQLIMTLEEIISNKSEIFEQDHAKATFTSKFKVASAGIDWSKNAVEIDRFIRSYSPKPGAWTNLDGVRVKILQSHLEEGQLVIDLVQLPGKKVMNLKDLKNGYPSIYAKLELNVIPA